LLEHELQLLSCSVLVSRISAGPVVAILAATAALAVLLVLAVSYALYLRGRR
jgi:hypothetical protein